MIIKIRIRQTSKKQRTIALQGLRKYHCHTPALIIKTSEADLILCWIRGKVGILIIATLHAYEQIWYYRHQINSLLLPNSKLEHQMWHYRNIQQIVRGSVGNGHSLKQQISKLFCSLFDVLACLCLRRGQWRTKPTLKCFCLLSQSSMFVEGNGSKLCCRKGGTSSTKEETNVKWRPGSEPICKNSRLKKECEVSILRYLSAKIWKNRAPSVFLFFFSSHRPLCLSTYRVLYFF